MDPELILKTLENSAGVCHPDCIKARNEQEDYDASESAAIIAVRLISAARVLFKVDTEYTEYSAQFLVDNAGKEEVEGEMDLPGSQYTLENMLKYLVENVLNKREDDQGEMDQQHRRDLTVKECLECAFKKGLPRRLHWGHVGCTFKTPPFTCQIPRVPMNGQVIEAADLDEALKLCTEQPVGVRLHVFSPEFELVGEEGIYDGPSGDDSRYVGLRDAIIVEFDKRDGKNLVTVQILYKKKMLFIKVSGRSMMLPLTGEDGSRVTEPTCLLVDFCAPLFN